jgi:hypothetical protein
MKACARAKGCHAFPHAHRSLLEFHHGGRDIAPRQGRPEISRQRTGLGCAKADAQGSRKRCGGPDGPYVSFLHSFASHHPGAREFAARGARPHGHV